MNPNEHIRRLRAACRGIDEHCENDAAAWTALHDIELDIHELDKAFERRLEESPKQTRH
jgi:hypothetical protein